MCNNFLLNLLVFISSAEWGLFHNLAPILNMEFFERLSLRYLSSLLVLYSVLFMGNSFCFYSPVGGFSIVSEVEEE